MSDPIKTVYNPKGSYYVESLWASLKKSFGVGKVVVKKASDKKC